MCNEYNVPFLGGLPLDIRIREQADSGRPTVVADPDGTGRADLPRDRAQGRDLRRAEGGETSRQVSEHRHPERHLAAVRPIPRPGRFRIGEQDDQVRQVDPPHGGGAPHDRAVRAGPGARGRRPQDRVVRHVELRLRHPLLARIQDLHQHQLDDRRSEGVRRGFVRRFRRATSASSRRIRSRWRARSSTSASRATC